MEQIKKSTPITGDARRALAEQLAAAYREGASIRVLAVRTGRSYGAVRQLLVEAGVQLRTRGSGRCAPRRASRPSVPASPSPTAPAPGSTAKWSATTPTAATR